MSTPPGLVGITAWGGGEGKEGGTCDCISSAAARAASIAISLDADATDS